MDLVDKYNTDDTLIAYDAIAHKYVRLLKKKYWTEIFTETRSKAAADKAITTDGAKSLTGAFHFVPDLSQDRQIIYIVGASRSGKSVLAGNYMRMYQEYAGGRIFVVSSKLEDRAFEGLKFVHLTLDDVRALLEQNDVLTLLEDSLILFDDIEGYAKEHRTTINTLQDLILKVGGSKHIYAIVVRHVANDGYETRAIILESTFVVIFPSGLTRRGMELLACDYLGYSKQDLAALLEDGSRYIVLKKTAPRLSMTQTHAQIS